MSESDRRMNVLPGSFWVMAALITLYVALCATHRDSRYGADAWEYHRAILALSENLLNPGNPTYDTDDASVRYSPYTLFWAAFSRMSGVDPYDTLSVATVVNAVLLMLGVAALVRTYGEGRCASVALMVMFSLFGAIPRFTCSYALGDLPFIGANSSNFSLAVTVWIWVLFRRFEASRDGPRYALVPAIILLSATAMLDHGMIGVLTQLGIWLFALTGERDQRVSLGLVAFVVGCGTAALCVAWPWYRFWDIATMSSLPRGVLSHNILRIMLVYWCFPAFVASLFAIQYRYDSKLVRVFLVGGYACYLAGVAAYILPGNVPMIGTLARLPLPGLIFFHLAIGVAAHRAGLFRASTWPGRVRLAFVNHRPAGSQAVLEICLAVLIVYCLIPQVYAILDSPHLGRAYVAPLLGKEDQQLRLKQRYDALLTPVGKRDVVLSDRLTSWPVPSSRGRIVSALHPEWLVSDERERQEEVIAFFEPGTPDAQRIALIDRWSVKWLLLNRAKLEADVYEALYREHAVVNRDAELVLMDIARWKKEKP